MMSLSRRTSDKMRGESVALLAPLWEKILSFKHFIAHPTQSSLLTSFSVQEDHQHLQLQNQLLETQIAHLQKQLHEQLLLSSQIAQMASLSSEKAVALTEEYQQSLQKILPTIHARLTAIPARVIFRSFDTWNSCLWINVGETANQTHHSTIIARNSPVVVGRAIVGIIDYVGKHQSRVRLISDSRLIPSVRAARGGEQDFLIAEQIERLLQQMESKKQLPLSPDDHKHLSTLLTQLKKNLQPFKRTWYLAKGELLGSSSPSRIGQNISLKGTGFNYDFADEEGDSRDLRNGKSLQHPQEPAIPILKVNDILVTTGMDGIFPPGFQVATVTRVELLKEGDYFYNLEAQPIAGPLEEISLVFVLPPVNQEPLEE